MNKIRVGIVGYGNVGRGAEKVVHATPDMELVGVFTRRDPSSVKLSDSAVSVYTIDDAANMKDKIDVMLLCGGSATDLAVQGPQFAAMFNIVCSFDTHAKIPEYLAVIDGVASSTTAVISSGWDPGLFSMMRLLSGSILPDGETYTFWGRGVSQGHSDAIRRVAGVKNGIQYTIPIEKAVEQVRSGNRPAFVTRDKHLRECFVVAEENADMSEIESSIKAMPNYFADYETTVHFISEEELKANHGKMPHGGMVLHSGDTGENNHVIEFSLKLDSNPEFTASVMIACARACHRFYLDGSYGAKTVFDIPLAYFSPKDHATLIKELL